MPKIHSIKEPFDLSHLRLSNPINKNGSHFIKTLAADDPLYFLAPKCFVKQGFVTHGKKIFCDFVFSNEDSEFLTWLENLELTVRSTIYTNREKWFETPLDEHDIESSMSSPYKFYKSGKFFIVRANVPTALGKINIKIYDEKEEETDPENIKENTNVLAVFEFQGIKCSVRSFQFEIELKQLLVVEPEKLFDKCIISKSSKPSSNTVSVSSAVNENVRIVVEEEPISKINLEPAPEPEKNTESDEDTTFEPELEQTAEIVTAEPEAKYDPEIVVKMEEEPSIVEILDVELALDKSVENVVLDEPPLKLKPRNDVYYKLYKEAREKAREAKREALTNYLEAKRIKNTYLLEDVSDSDSDLDEFDVK